MFDVSCGELRPDGQGSERLKCRLESDEQAIKPSGGQELDKRPAARSGTRRTSAVSQTLELAKQ